MSTLPKPPVGLDVNETKVTSIVSGFLVTWVLGLSSVFLRFTARRLTKAKLWWDDWLICASLVASAAFMIDVLGYMCARGGFGKHIWVAPADSSRVNYLGLFIAEYLYTISMGLVKFSILAFYWRIFSTRISTRWHIRIMVLIISAWVISVLLVTTFQCVPTSAFWGRFDLDTNLSPNSYKCSVDLHHFFIAKAIPNIITDFLMLLIPLPSIWNLQLRTYQKAALFAIFTVGLFITAISLIRMTYMLRFDHSDPSVNWEFSDEMMWTGVEVNAGIVCACLPLLKPLVNVLIYKNVYGSSPRPTYGNFSPVVPFGGSGQIAGDGLRLDPSSHGTMTACITSRNTQRDNGRTDSLSTDNELDTLSKVECDLESNPTKKDNENVQDRDRVVEQTANGVTVTRTFASRVEYVKSCGSRSLGSGSKDNTPTEMSIGSRLLIS